MMEQERSYVKGYCLAERTRVDFSYPKDVIGSLFHCPYCGFIGSGDKHVFNPSDVLLSALDKPAKIK